MAGRNQSFCDTCSVFVLSLLSLKTACHAHEDEAGKKLMRYQSTVRLGRKGDVLFLGSRADDPAKADFQLMAQAS